MNSRNRAWHGLNILIFGSTPGLPLQTEKAISQADPGLLGRIHAFEDYSEALDHCKKSKGIGFVILIEDSTHQNLVSYLRELAKPYESRGFPCFSALVAPTQKTIAGYQVKDASRNLLAYLQMDELIDSRNTLATFDQLWRKYIAAFESALLPVPLQETIFSIVEEEIDRQSVHFIDRVSLILSSQFNISWLEAFSIRWTPLLYSIPSKYEKAVSPHQDLMSLCPLEDFRALVNQSLKMGSLEPVGSAKEPVWCKISAVSYFLNKKREQNSLSESLDEIKNFVKPNGPKIFECLLVAAPAILEAASQEEKTGTRVVAS